ncbi:MAG: ElyC/SanA/YdcF family protein [Myxococcota bacterium]
MELPSTIFVLSGRGRPGRSLHPTAQLRLVAARVICERHHHVERVVFVGGAAPRPTALSLARYMKQEFERLPGRTPKLAVVDRSNTTAGNMREIAEVRRALGLQGPAAIVSRRAHFLRIPRLARRAGFVPLPLTIETVLGGDAMPQPGPSEVARAALRRVKWLAEWVDPDERVAARFVHALRRLTWRNDYASG